MTNTDHHFIVIGRVVNGVPVFEVEGENITDVTENCFEDGAIYDNTEGEWLDVEDAGPEIRDADELLFNTLKSRLN